jgi:membrane protein YqaA with SNARE-associated domain
MLHAAQVRVWILLHGATSMRIYPLLVGSVALLLTVSMTIPFASILIAAVLLRPAHWKAIALLSSVGSAAGGLIIYMFFHHLGWIYVVEAYPELLQSKAWIDATRWVSSYGVWALLVVAASPLPQTPALIFTAVSRLPPAEVFLALLIGKSLKYGVYAWLAATFPDYFHRIVAALLPAESTVPRDRLVHDKGAGS